MLKKCGGQLLCLLRGCETTSSSSSINLFVVFALSAIYHHPSRLWSSSASPEVGALLIRPRYLLLIAIWITTSPGHLRKPRERIPNIPESPFSLHRRRRSRSRSESPDSAKLDKHWQLRRGISMTDGYWLGDMVICFCAPAQLINHKETQETLLDYYSERLSVSLHRIPYLIHLSFSLCLSLFSMY